MPSHISALLSSYDYCLISRWAPQHAILAHHVCVTAVFHFRIFITSVRSRFPDKNPVIGHGVVLNSLWAKQCNRSNIPRHADVGFLTGGMIPI